MKIISPFLHGILDYVTIVFLFVSPFIFNMGTGLATFTFILGSIHLILTAFTDFKLGLLPIVHFRVHGMIELFVGAGLLVFSGILRNQNELFGFWFYLVISLAILTVWILSDYRGFKSSAAGNN